MKDKIKGSVEGQSRSFMSDGDNQLLSLSHAVLVPDCGYCHETAL